MQRPFSEAKAELEAHVAAVDAELARVTQVSSETVEAKGGRAADAPARPPARRMNRPFTRTPFSATLDSVEMP